MPPSEATTDKLLSAMHANQSALHGVGVVVHLSENAVLDFVKSELAAGTGSGRVVWCGNPTTAPGESIAPITQVGFEFGAPTVKFGDCDGITITLGILGLEQKVGSLVADGAFDAQECRCAADDPRATWESSNDIDLSPDAQLQITVPFSADHGATNTGVHSVVLEFAAAKFLLQNLCAEGFDDTAFSQHLQLWFGETQAFLTVASVDFDSCGDSALSLVPVSLDFDVVTSKGGSRILRLLIATADGPAGGSACIGMVPLEEPVPTDSGMDFSVIVSSKILFDDLVESFNAGSGLLKMVAASADSTEPSWHAITRNPMSYQGSISWGDVWKPITNNAELGLKLTGSKNEGLALSYFTSPGGNIDLGLEVTGKYPIGISGTGKDQKITVGKGSSTLTAADGVAETAVKGQLEKFLEGVTADLSAVSFARVASFVLNNLKFPGHLPALARAEIPSEFVIVGSFEKEST